jgi:hypothetical protein
MRDLVRRVLMAGTFALFAVAGPGAAKADVLRIAIATADNQADYDHNAATVATAKALLLKGTGVKAVYVLQDPAKMTVASVSVWPSEADIHSVTDSADWKSMVAGKLKYKTYTVEVFEVQ